MTRNQSVTLQSEYDLSGVPVALDPRSMIRNQSATLQSEYDLQAFLSLLIILAKLAIPFDPL